jgi:opacity protein-like surface antigen
MSAQISDRHGCHINYYQTEKGVHIMPAIKVLILWVVSIVLFMTSSALADSGDSGWYTGVTGGANFLEDQESTGPSRDLDLDFDTGGFVAGQLGYKFRANQLGRFRAEAEVSYRINEVDNIVFNGVDRVGNGEQDVLAGLMNLFFDFNGVSKNFKPFVGAGVGIATLDADISYSPGAFIDDDDTTLAYQAIVGAEFNLTEKLSIVGDARYFALDNPELTRFGGPAPAAFVDLSSEYESFSTSIGFRFKF